MTEFLASGSSFARLVASALDQSQLTLLDIGCGGGIDQAWRTFGDRLRAIAIDANVEEIKRLADRETLPGVTYVAGFVGLAKDDAGAERMSSGNFWARNPWGRLSVFRSLEIRARSKPALTSEEKVTQNLWPEAALADINTPIVIQSLLSAHGIDDVDFVKIDVDGADFLILRSISDVCEKAKVLGVAVEVNFFGSGDPEIHTLHNVDRFMKQQGFELFLLSTRPYSVAALPAPYQLAFPAQTTVGRILQGDALYFRDAGAPEQMGWAVAAGRYKLAKLAALFSLAGLPDCAAEVLLKFRSAIEPIMNVDAGLDALTAQLSSSERRARSYAEHMAEFEADSAYFYGGHNVQSNGKVEGPEGNITLPRASWRWTDPLRSLRRILRRQR